MSENQEQEKQPQQANSAPSLTPEQLLELLKPALGQLKSDILAELKQPEPTESKTRKSKGETAKDDLEVQALRTQLDSLQAERRQEKLTNKLYELASTHKVTNPNVFKKLILSEVGQSIEIQDGNFYVKQGDSTQTLDSFAESYLVGDMGGVLIKAADTNGSGSKEPAQPLPQQSKESLDSLLMKAF